MSSDRRVLITGGCGSVGSAVVAHLLETKRIQQVRIYDNDEQSLFALRQQMSEEYPSLEFQLGNVRNKERLVAAMRGTDYVIHTAGFKQVPQCESNPYASIRTNADGTWNVIQAAKEEGVDSVLTLSTDKAVNPTSTMGASKMLAERLTQAAAERTGPNGPRLGCVRLGNVVGSAGSVVPIFDEQIQKGGPVSITDPEMTRFAMSKRQAAEFIVDCVDEQENGRIHVPKIGRLRLIDLAEAMIDEYAPPGVESNQIETTTIGRRPGERLHEYLIGPTEVERTVQFGERYSVKPPNTVTDESSHTSDSDVPTGGLRSDAGPFMSHEQIIDLVKDASVTGQTTAPDAISAAVSEHDD